VKLGAEPKKVVILAVLLVIAAVLIYNNILSAPDYGAPSRTAAPSAPPPKPAANAPPSTPASAVPAPPRMTAPRGNASSRAAAQEFRPSLRRRDSAEPLDALAADPTLRLDLLARLKDVRVSGGARSLFEFGQPPPPKVPEPKILPKPVETAKETRPEENKSEVKPPKPPPPPIPLKFYGYSAARGAGPRRAFFLKGDEILVAGEGDLIDNRFKVVRIGLNSAVVQDMQYEDHRQTLVLEEPPPPA
jgi:hypothetical protein